MRVSVSAFHAWAAIGETRRRRRGVWGGCSARVMIRGACTDCRAHRVTTGLAGAAAPPCTQPVTCDDAWPARLSHWLRLINSQGLSAGRSGADSRMLRSGMPRYSMRASSCTEGGGWAGPGGRLGAFAVIARRTPGLHLPMALCARARVCVCVSLHGSCAGLVLENLSPPEHCPPHPPPRPPHYLSISYLSLPPN